MQPLKKYGDVRKAFVFERFGKCGRILSGIQMSRLLDVITCQVRMEQMRIRTPVRITEGAVARKRVVLLSFYTTTLECPGNALYLIIVIITFLEDF